jgi:alpha-beta hydrolase superfamily lysophospholipase
MLAAQERPMFTSQFNLPAKSGASLNVYHEPAAGDGRGVAVINHGLAEHAARYSRFAKALSAAGFHVYAHDHRGHGATTAPGVSLGSFAAENGWQRVLDDTLDVRVHAESQHPVLPLLLFGHSMGGLIAMNSALRDPDGIDALAVWNANFSAGLMGRAGQAILAVERMLLGSDVPSAILPKLTFQDWAKKETSGRTDFDWLSRDPAEVDKYVADPLCGWDASVGMWQDVFKLIFAGADDRNFSKLPKNLPVHLRGGGHDPATDFAKATKALATRLSRMGFANVTTDIGPDNRHECLNDTNRQEVEDRFVAWLNDKVR